MGCEIYLGSMCVFLEDLGFKRRDPAKVVESMTYYFYNKMLYSKIFADIDQHWIIEVCLIPEELHIDRWRLENGIYMVKEDLELDLHHPQSMYIATEFVRETLEIAQNESY